MWWLWCLLLLSPQPAAPQAGENAREIVRRAAERDAAQLDLRARYTYKQTQILQVRGKDGKLKKSNSHVDEVIYIDGHPYTRRIEKDGKPLSDKDAAEAQRKMEKEIAKRRHESDSQRRKRLAEEQKEREEERLLRRQIADAYDFRLLGEEVASGRPCWKIYAEPRRGFQGRGDAAKMLRKVRGTMWIDKDQYAIVKVDAETVEPFSVALGLFRLAKGATMVLDQNYINDELWAVERLRFRGAARMALVIGSDIDMEVRFHEYRKFAVESKVTVADEQ